MNNVATMPREQTRIVQRTIESALAAIRRNLQKPVYLQISIEADGTPMLRQIEFLTAAEFAELCRVEERTVYGWLERAEKTGLKCYRPSGSRQVLFEINEAIEWLMSCCNLSDE